MLTPSSRKPRMALATAGAAMVLAACGGPTVRGADDAAPATTAAATVDIAYTCADGRRIEARYDDTRPGQSGARLQVDGRSFELHNVVAASGARYASESGLRDGHGLQWWTRGDAATLSEMPMDHTAPGAVELTTCTAVRGQ